MITSTQEFSQFSSVVAEHIRSVFALHCDVDEPELCRRNVVESILTKLLGYRNRSDLQHALWSGSYIEYSSFIDISREQLGLLELPIEVSEKNFVEKLLFASIASAVATFHPPSLRIELSDDFLSNSKHIVESSSCEDDGFSEVYLSLIDHKIYPFSLEYDLDNLNRIALAVPEGLLFDELLLRLNTPYIKQQLAAIHDHLPLVGFYQFEHHLLEHHFQSFSFDSIRCLSPRINGFRYHHELMRLYLRYERFKHTRMDMDELGWASVAYLFSMEDSPFERLNDDLPAHVVNNARSYKEFTDICLRIFTEKLNREFTNTSEQHIYLPQSFSRLFGEGELGALSLWRSKVNIKFIKSEYRLWVNYNQRNSHRVDRLLDEIYETRSEAEQGAVQFLSRYKELVPNFDKFLNDQFILRIIDTSQYLDIARHFNQTVMIQSLGRRREKNCINRDLFAVCKDCQCFECRQQLKVEQLKCYEKFSFISGSGFSTTRLRGPVTVIGTLSE